MFLERYVLHGQRTLSPFAFPPLPRITRQKQYSTLIYSVLTLEIRENF